MESDIVQIIPLSNKTWVYYKDEGILNLVVGMGLKRNGIVVFLDSDDGGSISEIGYGGQVFIGILPNNIREEFDV